MHPSTDLGALIESALVDVWASLIAQVSEQAPHPPSERTQVNTLSTTAVLHIPACSNEATLHVYAANIGGSIQDSFTLKRDSSND